MKRFCASVAILALSGGLAFAQSGAAAAVVPARSSAVARLGRRDRIERGVPIPAERRGVLGRSGITGERPEQWRWRAVRSLPTISVGRRRQSGQSAGCARRGNPSDPLTVRETRKT